MYHNPGCPLVDHLINKVKLRIEGNNGIRKVEVKALD
jgi:metal-sulfur cluster biosynthetic enzyme